VTPGDNDLAHVSCPFHVSMPGRRTRRHRSAGGHCGRWRPVQAMNPSVGEAVEGVGIGAANARPWPRRMSWGSGSRYTWA
jgi:hypothetical protein